MSQMSILELGGGSQTMWYETEGGVAPKEKLGCPRGEGVGVLKYVRPALPQLSTMDLTTF